MLTNSKLITKLKNLLPHYRELRFHRITEIPMEIIETSEHLKREPDNSVAWRRIEKGGKWGGSWQSGWFRGDVELPQVVSEQNVYIHNPVGMEDLLFIDGYPRGILCAKHQSVLLEAKGTPGKKYHIAIEAYAGHTFPNVFPNQKPHVVSDSIFDGVYLAVERKDVSAFVFDLEILLALDNGLDENSLRKAEIRRELERVWAIVRALPQEHDESDWRPRLEEARAITASLLEKQNGPTAPTISVVAHSHLDTAWLWPLAETHRKCARTFSSMVNLLDQYPEVIFIQSTPYHADVVRKDYPELFEEMKRLIKEGRWEPNGAAWIEPDCNIPSGESLVRQFLIGINWTREMFDYTPDVFWQPDVFGYSAALPQILKGVGIPYFCTTKMAWNDTTRFPYDVFTWRGIDGSEVLAHLNHHVHGFDPSDPIRIWKDTQHKDNADNHLLAWGHGDGGGGPDQEGIENIRRVEDLEGYPRVVYTTVSDFMKSLLAKGRDLPSFSGELYLELHRGTLTSLAEIKRLNRKAEFALRDSEFYLTMAGLEDGAYPLGEMEALWKEFLVNHFHDIIPGTSIQRVNDEAISLYEDVLSQASTHLASALSRLTETNPNGKRLLLGSTLNWDRTSDIELICLSENEAPQGDGLTSQKIRTVTGDDAIVVAGLTIPAMGFATVDLGPEAPAENSPFNFSGNSLETPHYSIRFDELGRITRCVYKTEDRDLVVKGGCLNAFWCGEDVPALWDNWDIDADQGLKMEEQKQLVSREVVADGPLQLRIQQQLKVGNGSTLTQHLIFHANSPRIDFDTELEWNEKHQLLKVAFDIDVMAEMAKHEIQFGHVERPTHRNYPQDRARFEVANQKWTDISDNGFGVALLNDCKYGVSVEHTRLTLSLAKSGTHPDDRGDAGTHCFLYALLPHSGPFTVPNVVRPAYEFNLTPVITKVAEDAPLPSALLTTDAENIIVETIKWAEDGDGFIVRLYDAGKVRRRVSLQFRKGVKSVVETNILEEETASLELENGAVPFLLKPFEIKTLRVRM